MTEKHSFWTTMPGILTGIAAIITASGGLLIALTQSGVFSDETTEKQNQPTVAEEQAPIIHSGKPLSTGQSQGQILPAGSSSQAEDPKESRVNLLSREFGGNVLAATSDSWLESIDGKDNRVSIYALPSKELEAVYGFKGGRAATFDTFTMLITKTSGSNIKDFELLWGDESPTGLFHSIGIFKTENMKLFQTPFQQFKFPAVTAKYFKVRLLSAYQKGYPDIYEFELWGTLQ